MDIEYDPTEEVEDDVSGGLDYDEDQACWSINCSECGRVGRSIDGSAASHDAMIRKWPRHMQEKHHGDGIMALEDRLMLIEQDDGP